ncbi:hypothetical protein J2I47_14525 [Fibrella sp. HMF5335]|uniref:Cell division protein FtsQ n=1 Tax=Fibrella rubiginis TaxID=2817060 RepID=A0A939GG84_9BACT|nr:cell division protein FtsQ/DivIB [Fibrella rubiginis]MBO0937771.1 hypothetical protein [Fibrella rubiginis]
MFPTFSNPKKWLWNVLGAVTLFGLVAFTEHRIRQSHCEAIIVRLREADGQRFLTRKDVTGFLTNNGADPLVGKPYDGIDLGALEHRLGRYSLVKQAHLSRDLAGNLLVDVTQPQPVGRLIDGEGSGAVRWLGGQYISDEGRFFPLSMNYSARVPIVSGDWFRQHRTLADKAGRPLLELLTYIQQDELWKAQIAEIDINGAGEVTLWPQVGNYQIEFGTPDGLATKFKKVKLFYTQIAPRRGWDRYHRVNVQYRNQLVCE